MKNLVRLIIVFLLLKDNNNIGLIQQREYLEFISIAFPVIGLLEIMLAISDSISKYLKEGKNIKSSKKAKDITFDRFGRRNITENEKINLLEAIDKVKPEDSNYKDLYNLPDELYANDILVETEDQASVMSALLYAVDKELRYIEATNVLHSDGRTLICLKKIYDHNNNMHEYYPSDTDISMANVIAYHEKRIMLDQETLNFLHVNIMRMKNRK